MPNEIAKEELRQLVDFAAIEAGVCSALEQATVTPQRVLRFLSSYAYWNGWFGSGVATLSGKVGRSRALFVDASEPVLQLADRSVLVASHFFDAARDEFDDRDTPHRDTHRCLAQATLKGTLDYVATQQPSLNDAVTVNALLQPAPWLEALGARVAHGYGAGTLDDLAGNLRAMGYHLGSEILADREFSRIDQLLTERQPALVAALQKSSVRIADEQHVAYQWIRIHSGHGGGVEADHFAWATRGVRLCLSLLPAAQQSFARRQLHLGFIDFSRDHREFFENVNQD
ncbi:MAG: hypothetical protein RLZZ450_1486 [Pseudomonadota bacterium]